MSKPIIDLAAASRIRTDLKASGDGLVTDQVAALARAIETLLRALEAAK